MDVRIRCRDRRGRMVVVAEDCWLALTRRRRTALLTVANADDLVRLVIEQSALVTRDPHGRYRYYRKADLPVPHNDLFLRVVVIFPQRVSDRIKGRLLRSFDGDVVDLDLVDRRLPRETQWRPPPM